MTSTRGKLFVYAFYVDKKETECTAIRIHGIDSENKSVCLRVDNFTPFVMIELPKLPGRLKWSKKLAETTFTLFLSENLRKSKPLRTRLVYRKKLYSSQIQSDGTDNKFPFLFCTFAVKRDVYSLKKLLFSTVKLPRIQSRLRFKLHEANADEILQLACTTSIPTAGWLNYAGKMPRSQDTLADTEVCVPYNQLSSCNTNKTVNPLILSFDIEAYSHAPGKFPDAEHPDDKVFMISCVFFRDTQSEDADFSREVLLTLGNPRDEDVGAECVRFETEGELIEGFANIIREMNPQIITGWNILGFDIEYMIKRSKITNDFDRLGLAGMHKTRGAGEAKIIKWKSSAYRNQEFQYLDWEGRVIVDLLPVVRRDHKLDNYKLDTVGKHFLGGVGKEDLSPKELFKCYDVGIKDRKNVDTDYARNKVSVAGKYCMVDSRLVAHLFRKTQAWVGLTEMAATCNVPMFELIVRGQQKRVFAQVYKYCSANGIVVETEGYKAEENERYVGAYVFEPVPGVYDNIVPFDFASLYPTTIIAYNIDYSTLVQDRHVPDSHCHVIEWEDHLGCCHDPKVKRLNELNALINSREKEMKTLRTKRDTLTVNSYLPGYVRGKKYTRVQRKGASVLRNREKAKINRSIKRLEAKLKPYREERADVKKGIPKITMCAQRRYRFLKEPKGVIPTILQNLLDARANTRKIIKTNKKIIPDLDGEDETDMKMLNSVLNQRQLAYKVCSNSMYGAMGVREGYLPFMPGAMCTTAMGRRNNKLAAKTIVDKWQGKLVYGDSVTGDTPIMVKYPNCTVDIVTIETLAKSDYEPYDQFKAGQSNRRDKQQAKVDVQVWADGRWANVNRVIRHKTKKRIFRILTHTGFVDVTEDHSLLDASGRKLKPVDAKIGQELLHAFPVEFCSDCKDISAEEAFAMGLFFGDGSCGDYTCPSGRKRSWALNNSNLDYLNEAQQCLEKCEPTLGWKVLDTIKSSGVYKLVPQGNVKYIVEKYRALFYDKDKYKKVPMCILNAPVEVRREFVRGYRVADGTKTGSQRADCKGKIGCQGLYYLFCSLGENVSINTRESKPNIFRLNSTGGKFRKNPIAIKKIIDLGYNDENEFVYDIETTQGRFCGGVGRLILKNTDSEYVFFPHITGETQKDHAEKLWDYCLEVAEDVTKLYPAPMKLEFEEEIYRRFLILSKKRYMYKLMKRDGVVQDKVGNKGVLLSRRDNSNVVRDLYAGLVQRVFNNVPLREILDWVFHQALAMFRRQVPVDKFTITKAVGGVGNLPLLSSVKGINTEWIRSIETGAGNTSPEMLEKLAAGKVMVGDYTIPKLSKQPVERARQLKLKQATDDVEYYTNSLPAHVSLAMKMRARGIRVDDGTRLEHLVTFGNGHTDKLFSKVEDVKYFKRHSEYLKIDNLYYLKAMTTPVDQVLTACFGVKHFMKNLYKHWIAREKIVASLVPRPKLIFLI